MHEVSTGSAGPVPARVLGAFGAVVALVVGLLTLTAPVARAAGIEEVTGFGSNPGNLRMFRYVPDGLPTGRPLVVAMHGCTQDATGYGTSSGWVELADRWGFSLLLPQQQFVNQVQNCFTWYEPGDTTRGQGEAASIAQMIQRMLADTGADSERVYVTGLSAGGAMTTVMLATYPDLFAGGGIVAGLPYRCATTLLESLSCMNPGRDRTAQQWGDLVRAASSYRGPWPTVSIWHGTADYTVAVANQQELVEQWTDVHGTDATPDVTDTVAGYPHAVYRDSGGRAVVETYRITGMGHGQPVDPGTGTQQCGRTAAYMLDVNVCAAWHMGRTWGLDSGSGPGEQPGVLTLRGIDAFDGYVKAASDGSGAAVGTLEGTLGLAVGRGVDGQVSRTVLAFDTSAIPAGATVTRAWLTVDRASGSGDPWSSPAGNRLVVDLRSGCFGNGCGIEAADWAAPADLSAIVEIPRTTSGQARSGDLPPQALAALNRAGTTQFRLRFLQDPPGTAYVFFRPGTATTLTVEYEF